MMGMESPGAMRVLAGLLEARTGQQLAANRMWRIETALKPMLKSYKMDSLEDLVSQLLSTNKRHLLDEVVDALLNNESSFFRDLSTFSMIERGLLPHIGTIRKQPQLRIWCAGCSIGQEALSLAMLIQKQAERWQGWRVQILATDISSGAIARAKSGLYSQMEVQRGLGVTELLQWFEPAGDDWRVSRELLDMIDYRVDNLLEPVLPAGAYDLILCRNVLLYFSLELRQKVFENLARFAAPEGHLVLGAGETVIGQTDDFIASRQFRGSYERRIAGAIQRSPAASGRY
ncbi:MAG: protein-glutamate O-methyltransferase CheR [Alphaproteobacteria bacterium]|nr:protein-glutamate O-methyltransferase CheR [Alphaproteobacteria bacterium]